MASMMGPSNVGSASGFTSPNAPRRPPQIQTQQQGPPSGQQPTFGQMQSQGQPRPAPPPSWYNYTPGSTQQRPQPSYGTQPSQGGGFNPGSTAGGAGYAPGSGYRPPQAPQGPVTNAGGANPPMSTQTPQGGGFQNANAGLASSYGTTDQGYRPAQGPSQYQPPNPSQLVNGITQNPMVQWGQRVAGFPQTPIIPPGTPQTPQAPQTPPSGINVPPGGAQYGSNPAATSDQQNAANQLGTATQNLLLNQLNNPNPYSSPAVQTQMQNAQQMINEQSQQAADAVNSNLASRGVYDSSLAGGYLADIGTQAGRQLQNVAIGLLPQMANQYQTGINSAIANSLGYGGQQYQQAYQTAGLNLEQQQMQNQQLQQLLSLTQQ